MPKSEWEPELVEIVERALEEDGAFEDPASALLGEKEATARILVREDGVVAGLRVADLVFRHVDPQVRFRRYVEDGDRVAGGREVAQVGGNARAIAAGERTALNLLARMSGIATMAARFVDAVKGTGVTILDTRKTAPGLRFIDKEAVRLGGAYNHRLTLTGMMLLKENHLAVLGGMRKALAMSRVTADELAGYEMPGGRLVRLAVEVTNFEELEDALEGRVDWILLDNMAEREIRRAVEFTDSFCRERGRERPGMEASGGADLTNIRGLATTGVDAISVGMLTHSAPALDFSLVIIEKER